MEILVRARAKEGCHGRSINLIKKFIFKKENDSAM